MFNLWHNLQPVEGGQYLVEVQVSFRFRIYQTVHNLNSMCNSISYFYVDLWELNLYVSSS